MRQRVRSIFVRSDDSQTDPLPSRTYVPRERSVYGPPGSYLSPVPAPWLAFLGMSERTVKVEGIGR